MADTAPMLPLTDDHIHAIGYVTAYSSLLATMLENAIWGFLGVAEKEGRAITSGLTLQNSLHLFKTLGNIKIDDPKVKAELEGVASDIETVAGKRNKIVHANWYYYSPSTKKAGALRVTAKGKLKTSLTGYTAEQIMDIAKEILNAVGRLQRFFTVTEPGYPSYINLTRNLAAAATP